MTGASFRPLYKAWVPDFSTNIARPYATMILAQRGTNAIKVESPADDGCSDPDFAELLRSGAALGPEQQETAA